MATNTYKFIANSSFQLVTSGPSSLTINCELKGSELFIGQSAPAADNSNTFILKQVAGENYLTVNLASGDGMYIKSIGDTSRISVIEETS